MIPDIRIEVEPITYWKRIRFEVLFLSLLLPFLLILLNALSHDFSLSVTVVIPIWGIFGGIIFLSIDADDKYFITLFEIKNGKLHIEFLKRNTAKILNGNVSDFTFRYALNHGQNSGVCFEIRKNDSIIIKQSCDWNWRKHFFGLLEYLEQYTKYEDKTFGGVIKDIKGLFKKNSK